jgi:methyltransferase (TIGR00027 family)
VAAQRATESSRPDRLFDDQVAVQIVAAAGNQLPAWFFSSRSEALRPAIGDYIAMRTRYFDDYLLEAVASGVRQAVVLAAGFDARAYRLDWPAPVRLFELDRPDVFSIKERIVTGRSPRSRCERTAVFSDLLTDWPSDLLAQGFDPGQPTAWLAEGLVMFLSEQAADGMLARIGELSAPGSRIGVDDGATATFKAEIMTAAPAGAGDDNPLHMLASLWRNNRTTDPVAWLAGHGWSATFADVAGTLVACGRPVPPAFDPQVPGTVSMRLLTGCLPGQGPAVQPPSTTSSVPVM